MSTFQLPTSQAAIQIDAGSSPIPTIRVNQTAEMPVFPKSGINTIVRIDYNSPNPIDYKFLAMSWPIPRLVVGVNPIIPGASFVGRVWKTNHPEFKAGDLVWGKHDDITRFGSGGTFTLVSGDQGIVKVPETWPKDRGTEEFAGAAMVALTALQTLQAGDLPYNTSNGQEKGGNVFINGGSGGVGTFTVQLAKHVYGCDYVVSSCSGSNADLVKSLGADEVVDYRKLGPAGLSGHLKDWSKRTGKTFDVIIDNVGNDSDLYWQSHHYLKADKGSYVQVGGGLGLSDFALLAKKMMWPSILGGGKRRYQFVTASNKKETFKSLGQWMAEGKLKCVIEDENRFDLRDAKRAYEKLDTGRLRGKIVIKMNSDQ